MIRKRIDAFVDKYAARREKKRQKKMDEEEINRFKDTVGHFPALLHARADELEKQIAFSRPEFLILQTEKLKAVVEQLMKNVSWISWRIDLFDKARNRQLMIR